MNNMCSLWGQIIPVSESECSICPVYLKFPMITVVLFLLSVKRDLLGPLYFFFSHLFTCHRQDKVVEAQ